MVLEKLLSDEKHLNFNSNGLKDVKVAELTDSLDGSNISSIDTLSTQPSVVKVETAAAGDSPSVVVSPDIMQDKSDNKESQTTTGGFSGLFANSTAVPSSPEKAVPGTPVAGAVGGRQDLDIPTDSGLLETPSKSNSAAVSDANQNGTEAFSSAPTKADDASSRVNSLAKEAEDITQVSLKILAEKLPEDCLERLSSSCLAASFRSCPPSSCCVWYLYVTASSIACYTYPF